MTLPLGGTYAAGDDADDVHTRVDAPDFGSLAWIRRASGDVRLAPWRLTPERLAAYLDGVRALASAGPAVEAEDPGAVLDPDRQPLLRPWELSGPAAPGEADPAHALADLLATRPTLSAVLRPRVALAEFAAAQLKLVVCARALVLLVGDDAAEVSAGRIRAWIEGQDPRPGAEEDFAASLMQSIQGRSDIAHAFTT